MNFVCLLFLCALSRRFKMTGSELFTRYEGDLIAIIKSAKNKLADQIPISDKGKRDGGNFERINIYLFW